MAKNKVIMVGMCQSGHLSVAAAIHSLGYNSMGYNRPAFMYAQRQDFSLMERAIHDYDCVRDYPFNIYYLWIREHCHPQTKFILTYRRDLNHWFDKLAPYAASDLSHICVHKHWWGKHLLSESDRALCVQKHESHCNDVRNVLGKSNFLEYSIDDNLGWGPICDFLGEPVPRWRFPDKSNRSRTISINVKRGVAWSVWDSMIPNIGWQQ